MSTPLLMTRLYQPLPRVDVVARPRLIELLDEGLRHGRRLTLVSAPAGFGKTTLVVEWVACSVRDVAWLSLDEEDNDPKVFFTYLSAALHRIDAEIGHAARALLSAPQQPPVESIVTLLVNDLAAGINPLTLVLDDVQLVQSPQVYDALGVLLDRQPPHVHLVLITRHDPPLPLARLRARGQVTEVRERDLRFTIEEAAAFLRQTMGLSLSPEAVRALESHTEGWITGLQLAALALQEGPGAADTDSFVACFAGDDRYVVDYLMTEVLDRQAPAMREFLRQTSILDRLTAPLCDAIVKIKDWSLGGGRQLPALRSRPQSQAFLEHLDDANLFLVPLDNRRQWYRYHRLFAEFLRTTLDREEQIALHRRAARWHEDETLTSRAIHHALAHAKIADDWGDAERLIRLVAEETIQKGELLTLGKWLDALPEASVRGDGTLATYRAWVLALNGEVSRASEYARAASAHLDRKAPAAERGKLLTLRSFLAVFAEHDYEAALHLAAEALALLDEAQAYWRVMALWAMAESQERTRDVTEAIATLREARRTGRLLGGQLFLVPAELFLATTLQLHGERREAVAVCEEAIEWYTDAAGRTSPVAGMLFSRLGMLHHEAGELEPAWQCLERGISLSQQLAMDSPIMYSLGFAAPTLCALGRADEALAALREAHRHGQQNGLADADWCLAVEANLRLSLGDVPWVQRWADEAGLSLDEEPHYLRMDQHLVYARLLLRQGKTSEVRTWLDALESFARARGLIRWLLTIQVLQALAADREGDSAAAQERLAQAVRFAAPERYVRAFLEEDARVLALLAHVRHVAPGFVDRLLGEAAVSPAPVPQPKAPTPRMAAQPLIEPLSERELEVLALVAAGLSNREIADRLFIAVGTVKRHINNIHGKLQVRRRTEAVARGRDLGLL